MARLTAYETYCLFVALKLHFTTMNYDFFRYNGKTSRVSQSSFLSRKDRFQFQKLCRLHNETEMQDFIASNLAKGIMYPVDLISEQAEENYQEFLKRKQSFSYIFSNEIDKLFSSASNPADVFKKIKGEYPAIINQYLNGMISLETVCVLNAYVRFISRMDERLGTDDVIWSKMRLLITKFTPFVQYDKDKVKSILKNAIYT